MGYTHQKACFLEYRPVKILDHVRQIPVFEYNNQEILGSSCFWLKESDIKSQNDLERFQKEIIPAQIAAIEVAQKKEENIPIKMKDSSISEVAGMKKKFQTLVEQHGFDPTDTSWIETSLAENDLEKKWFHFERKHKIDIRRRTVYRDVEIFNSEYHEKLSGDQAYALSKKRSRYIDGSYHTRMSWEEDREKWKQAALDFCKRHEQIEQRMVSWSIAHKGRFPLAKVKKPLEFHAGPLWNMFVEKVPGLFTDAECNAIEEGMLLQVVSYDPVNKYMRLNFTEEVIKLVDPTFAEEPWLEDWYVIKITPDQVNTHLELTGPLD